MADVFTCRLDFNRYARELAIPVSISCRCGNCEKCNSPVKSCKAIFDTGATSSMISCDTASELELFPSGSASVSGVHGTEYSNIYIIDLIFSNGFCIPEVRVSESVGSAGFDLLIGMDIISKGTLLVSGHNGRTFFYFQYPA